MEDIKEVLNGEENSPFTEKNTKKMEKEKKIGIIEETILKSTDKGKKMFFVVKFDEIVLNIFTDANFVRTFYNSEKERQSPAVYSKYTVEIWKKDEAGNPAFVKKQDVESFLKL